MCAKKSTEIPIPAHIWVIKAIKFQSINYGNQNNNEWKYHGEKYSWNSADILYK